ncbi:MAG: efflux RND transporter periplasmic adaptor subunit [Alphaproteobacteria bacterium]|nr:efflux RND transporter periplasmic adaptor subunit [Alphaproteobacteria bacterium]
MKMGKVDNGSILGRVFLMAVCVGAGWFLKSRLTPPMGGMAGMASGAPYVLVKTVKHEDVTPFSSVIGHVEALNSVSLQPQVSGYLEDVTFIEGSYVNEGDVLFVIEKQRYQATADLRKAELDAAKASLTRITKDYNRQKSLNQQKFASEAKLDEAYASLLQAQAAVKQAQANYELALIDLEHAEIKAPFSGKIGKAKITEGNYVSPASGVLASVVQTNPVRITFSMTDKQISDILQNGMKNEHVNARIELPNGKLVRMKSVNEFMDNAIDTNTATIAVYAEFQNDKEELIPGSYVNMNIDSGASRQAIVVPQSSIGQDEHGNYVLTVNNEDTVEQKRVSVGEALGSNQIIESGLKDGDRVIVQGLQKVADGKTVRAENINAEEK